MMLDRRAVLLDSAGMKADSAPYQQLRQHYLFEGLPDGLFSSLAAGISLRQLSKGEVIFHRGDVSNSFFFVHEGQVELSLVAQGGEKKVLEIVGPGRTFAEAVTFMRDKTFPVTGEALTDIIVSEVPSRPYVDILEDNTNACMRLLGDISRHLHSRVREIERLTVQNARSRLSSYLLEHIVDANDDEATVRLDLPRHVIASRLSMQPETLSRLLRNLADDGVITIEDRIIFVHSLMRLRPYD